MVKPTIREIIAVVMILMAAILYFPSNSLSMQLSDEFWMKAANSLSPGMFPDIDTDAEHVHRYCGTPYLLPVANRDIDIPAFMKPLIERPFLQESYDTPEGNFKIHYDITGIDAVRDPNVDEDPADGVPDYINFVGDVCEYVWSVQMDSLGFNAPPDDDYYPAGGDARYDIYVMDLGANLFGLTVPDEVYDYPKYTSFIEIDNDYGWYPMGYEYAVKVTMAHEFFHAVQLGYDATEYPEDSYSPWWYECTAVWMEEQVYDDINDYINYLPEYFNNPEISLLDASYHYYASCVWPIYLSERFDQEIIRKLWELCGETAEYNVILASQDIFTRPDLGYDNLGYSFDRAFSEFAMWNYFTGSRAENIPDSMRYSEAHTWPKIPEQALTRISPYVDTSITAGNEVPAPPEYLAANYISFAVNQNITGGLRVGFDGNNNINWRIGLVAANLESSVSPPIYKHISLDIYNFGADSIRSWQKYTEILLIPCPVGTHYFHRDATYAFGSEFSDSILGDEPIAQQNKIHNNYPNPLNLSSGSGATYFRFELTKPAKPRIKIYTVAGELVKELKPKGSEKLPPGFYEATDGLYWDGTNEEGRLVAAGVYIYHFYTDTDVSEAKKLVVIR